MKHRVIGRLILIAITLIAALVYLLPNTPVMGAMPQWWKSSMPTKGITLGLDLQGGLHLVFEVDGDRAVEITTERVIKAIEEAAAEKKIDVKVARDGFDIVVTPGGNEEIKALVEKEFWNYKSEGEGRYALDSSEVQRLRDNSIDQALETIRNRIDQFGVAEPVIHRQAQNEIVVQLPGIKDPKRAIEIIGKTALLEFKIVDQNAPLAGEFSGAMPASEADAFLESMKDRIPQGDEILFERSTDPQTGREYKTPYLIRKEVLLSGDLLTEARVSIDQRYNEPYVSIKFNSAGSRIFEDVTGKHVQERMAIVLDGNIYSAPVIRERIAGGDAQISGNFQMEEAKDLAIVLKAGALPAPVKMLQNVTVGPSLGRDSIEAGKKAGLIGAALVVVFMIVYYRLSGMIADLALVLNIVLLLGAMAALGATMTLPGIAGVILAVGMAVDSNVLMFERMREELRTGKTPRSAVDSGYDKAFWTIFDSHVTTLITAAVLFQFGTGPIKGFAVTLSLGVIINLFTALIGTKTLFDMIYQRGDVKELSI
jgi:preprotein translocase subunit SecD